MTKVLISPAPLHELEGPWTDALRKAGCTIVYPKRKGQLTEDELLEALTGISAVVAGSEPYTPKVFQTHPQVKVVARAGVGYDAVNLEAATSSGAAVAITPGTNQDAVAEHAFALILALAKGIVLQHLGTVALKWPRKATLPLRGRTLGIAGLGRIGKSMAIRGAAFGMKLLAYEPFPDADFVKQHQITLLSFEDLLRQSDWLSLHMPATEESKHIINKRTLSLMKPTAHLINTARGAIVHEGDLAEALKEGKLAGAGLDVFEQEPPDDSPLFHRDNVVVTPHAAGVDLQSRDDMAFSAVEAILSLRQGEWPAEKIVNPAVKAKFRWA